MKVVKTNTNMVDHYFTFAWKYKFMKLLIAKIDMIDLILHD